MTLCRIGRRASAAAAACVQAGASTRCPASQSAQVVALVAAPRLQCPELPALGTFRPECLRITLCKHSLLCILYMYRRLQIISRILLAVLQATVHDR